MGIWLAPYDIFLHTYHTVTKSSTSQNPSLIDWSYTQSFWELQLLGLLLIEVTSALIVALKWIISPFEEIMTENKISWFNTLLLIMVVSCNDCTHIYDMKNITGLATLQLGSALRKTRRLLLKSRQLWRRQRRLLRRSLKVIFNLWSIIVGIVQIHCRTCLLAACPTAVLSHRPIPSLLRLVCL